MIRNIDFYQLTQLAEASYADLWNSIANSPFLTDDKVGKQLEKLNPKIQGYQATSLLSNGQ